MQLGGVPVVLDERPELLQAVELTRVRVADALLLKDVGIVVYLTSIGPMAESGNPGSIIKKNWYHEA